MQNKLVLTIAIVVTLFTAGTILTFGITGNNSDATTQQLQQRLGAFNGEQ